jgi:GNAT superfamily N-acetyltransferase
LDNFNKVSKANDKIRLKNAPKPHIYIWVLAVIPEHQGKGYSKKMLAPLIKKADEEKMPCYLERYKKKNVEIYGHFGFECIEEYPVPETSLTLYSMLRNTKL